jgi:hypothetical protein
MTDTKHKATSRIKYYCGKGVWITFMSDRMMISILPTYDVSPNGQKTVQRCHSDVHRIDTIVISDMNVIQPRAPTPPCLFYNSSYIHSGLGAVKVLIASRHEVWSETVAHINIAKSGGFLSSSQSVSTRMCPTGYIYVVPAPARLGFDKIAPYRGPLHPVPFEL